MRKTASSACLFPSGADTPPPPQGCDHPDCTEAGLYRAPKARQRLNEYYWFCLDHVRDYNRLWNYYAGMGPAEIEAQIRADTVWRRPTWPLGSWSSARRRPGAAADEIEDAFELFGAQRRAQQQSQARRREPQSAEEQALAVLNLAPPVTFKEIRLRYKDLVKQLHPDTNGGDKAAEEQLKLINHAYSTLKSSTTFKEGARP